MINYFKYQINLYNELYKCIRMSGRYSGFENLAALQGFPSLRFFRSVKICHGAEIVLFKRLDPRLYLGFRMIL